MQVSTVFAEWENNDVQLRIVRLVEHDEADIDVEAHHRLVRAGDGGYVPRLLLALA